MNGNEAVNKQRNNTRMFQTFLFKTFFSSTRQIANVLLFSNNLQDIISSVMFINYVMKQINKTSSVVILALHSFK